ncbi:MAG: N-acetylmuramoyl-L-alanine amidase [Neisseriaceae bacterium]
MSGKINDSRRQFVKLSLLSSLTLIIKDAIADDLSDLIGKESNIEAIKRDNKIIDIRIWPSNIYSRLTIETVLPIKAKYFILSDPSRLVIDIRDAKLNDVVKNLKSQVVDRDTIVEGVRVGQFNATMVRVVIYLKVAVKVQSQLLDPIKFGSVNYKYRYLLDIYNQSATSGSAKQDDLDDDLLAMLQLDSESTNNIKRQSYPSIQTPTKISNRKAKKIIVMLDPGHGGEDPGAIGPSFLKEKHVVLDIAKRLRELINQSDSIHAEMTRTSDIFIPLGTRVAIARRARADLFISIHADAFTTPKPYGSSVFILSDKGASSSFARWLARTQNQSDQIGGISFKTQIPSVRRVLLDMSQTWTRRQSSKFGTLMIDSIAQIHKMHNFRVEQASFAVLKAPDIPSILVETAFISNLEDESLLKTDAFKDKIAHAIFAGIEEYSKTLV